MIQTEKIESQMVSLGTRDICLLQDALIFTTEHRGCGVDCRQRERERERGREIEREGGREREREREMKIELNLSKSRDFGRHASVYCFPTNTTCAICPVLTTPCTLRLAARTWRSHLRKGP